MLLSRNQQIIMILVFPPEASPYPDKFYSIVELDREKFPRLSSYNCMKGEFLGNTIKTRYLYLQLMFFRVFHLQINTSIYYNISFMYICIYFYNQLIVILLIFHILLQFIFHKF